MASKLFNEQSQRLHKKAGDFALESKKLFQQVFPGEDVNSTFLLWRYLTGLRPTNSRQKLLRKNLTLFSRLLWMEVELPLSFNMSTETSCEAKINLVMTNSPA